MSFRRHIRPFGLRSPKVAFGRIAHGRSARRRRAGIRVRLFCRRRTGSHHPRQCGGASFCGRHTAALRLGERLPPGCSRRKKFPHSQQSPLSQVIPRRSGGERGVAQNRLCRNRHLGGVFPPSRRYHAHFQCKKSYFRSHLPLRHTSRLCRRRQGEGGKLPQRDVRCR